MYTHTQTQSAMEFSKHKRSSDPLVEQAKRPHLIDACEGSSPYNSPAQSTGSSCSGISVDGKYISSSDMVILKRFLHQFSGRAIIDLGISLNF